MAAIYRVCMHLAIAGEGSTWEDYDEMLMPPIHLMKGHNKCSYYAHMPESVLVLHAAHDCEKDWRRGRGDRA